MLPFALTARNVFARPVTARLVVVAEVVVESTAMRFVNVELAVEMMPLLKVWRALHVFALPKFQTDGPCVDPLYPPGQVRVPSAVRELRFKSESDAGNGRVGQVCVGDGIVRKRYGACGYEIAEVSRGSYEIGACG